MKRYCKAGNDESSVSLCWKHWGPSPTDIIGKRRSKRREVTPFRIALQRALIWLLVFFMFALLISMPASAVVFGDDSRTDPICINEAAAKIARSVAHFDTATGNCSAFLISPRNHVITAAHCLKTGWDNEDPGAKFIFNKQSVSCGSSTTFPLIEVPVDLSNLVTVDFDLDVALFQLPEDVAISKGLRWLTLDPDTRLSQLNDQEKLLFIPAWNTSNDRIQVALDQDCRIKDVPTTCRHLPEGLGTPPPDACLEHECDSDGGASGSPTLTTFNSLTVGMHAGSVRDNFLIVGSDEDSFSVKSRNFYPEIQNYLPADLSDSDQDGVPDVADNCPTVANTGTCSAGTIGVIHCLHDRDCDTSFGALDGTCEGSQLDSDSDGVGDLCDTLPPDSFEENDVPTQPAAVTTGNYSLTLDNRFDEDFYLITVDDDFSYVRIVVTRTSVGEIVMEVSDFDTGLPSVGPNEEISTTNYSRRFNARQVPAGKRYLVHVFELGAAVPMEYEMSVHARQILPLDEYEPNNSEANATSWPAGCDFDITVSPAGDVDFYAFNASNSSVRASIIFNPAHGAIQLFLDGVEATQTTTLGDRTQLEITGCAQSPSFIKVTGDMNFYDICIQQVPLQPTCPGYQQLTWFSGGGSFEFIRTNQWVPGPPEQHTKPLRKLMIGRVEETSATSVTWSLFGAVNFWTAMQPIHGWLQIPRPNPAGPVPFGPVPNYPLIRERPGLVAWYQIPPVGNGEGTFGGADYAITSFNVTSSGLQWKASLPDDQGTLTMYAGIDGDRDGIRDDLENISCTDPNDDDTDDDGLLDGTEDANGNGQVDLLDAETDPCNPDSDGDGVLDGVESGLTAPEGQDTDLGTFRPDLDPTTTSDPTRTDTDGDSRSDGEEDANGNGMLDEGETSPIVYDPPEPSPFNWTDIFSRLFSKSSNIALFRKYRDEYLVKSKQGKRYTTLLYKNSNEALTVLIKNPRLMTELKAMIDSNKGGVTKVLNGKEGVVNDTNNIISFLDKFAEKSPPDLKNLTIEVKQDMINSQKNNKLFLGFRLE